MKRRRIEQRLRVRRGYDLGRTEVGNKREYGFTYCGIIYLASGDERLAYQYYDGDTLATRAVACFSRPFSVP